MATTTIRVDAQTHARLLELSRAADRSLTETVRLATQALERQEFARRVSSELEVLSSDPEAWRAYLGESADTLVPDGID